MPGASCRLRRASPLPAPSRHLSICGSAAWGLRPGSRAGALPQALGQGSAPGLGPAFRLRPWAGARLQALDRDSASDPEAGTLPQTPRPRFCLRPRGMDSASGPEAGAPRQAPRHGLCLRPRGWGSAPGPGPGLCLRPRGWGSASGPEAWTLPQAPRPGLRLRPRGMDSASGPEAGAPRQAPGRDSASGPEAGAPRQAPGRDSALAPGVQGRSPCHAAEPRIDAAGRGEAAICGSAAWSGGHPVAVAALGRAATAGPRRDRSGAGRPGRR